MIDAKSLKAQLDLVAVLQALDLGFNAIDFRLDLSDPVLSLTACFRAESHVPLVLGRA